MSEHEFDFYLSVLESLLRLSPAQREQIGNELRDHLEERLEELTRQGSSRQEAIRSALSEFGDAASLAAHFTRIGKEKQRRLIMRCTLGTMASAVAVLILSAFFWPENQAQGPARAVAQPPAKQKPATDPATRTVADRGQAEVEAKLSARVPKLEFVETPFTEAIALISDAIGIDILIDRQTFEGEGVATDSPVNLQIKHTTVSARTALELILEQIGGQTLGYTIRDGVVYLTQKYQVDEIQVYNCRDLVHGIAMQPGPGGFGGEGGPGAGPGLGSAPGGLGGGPPMGLGGGLGGMAGMGYSTQSALVAVISTTIHPNSWIENGGQGSVSEFDGLLIVKHSQTVHREIKQLLAMMRAAAAEGPEKGQ